MVAPIREEQGVIERHTSDNAREEEGAQQAPR